ncbi:MAG: hypothetical protein RMK51_12965 [Meiothermus sp.]|uniref:hypothetical protein n=1 Tax=Meiothermus sp. TaxID=1955249 RepID=UPI00298F00A2|nr:hypothetical protein [Meiothermus sp.]MCX7803057.1 hypothetical protein [Meiothermus ruber]MDW8426834.1 hypothetical protein [Meiothermus sp.]
MRLAGNGNNSPTTPRGPKPLRWKLSATIRQVSKDRAKVGVFSGTTGVLQVTC